MYLDYSVCSGPFLSFSLRFEFHSEISDHSVCETRDLSLTIERHLDLKTISNLSVKLFHIPNQVSFTNITHCFSETISSHFI